MHPDDWRTSGDPAELFLMLWRYVNASPRERLANAASASVSIIQALPSLLARSKGTAAVDGVCNLLARNWPSSQNFLDLRTCAGLALALMQAIDTQLLALHPRSVCLATRPTTPSWLDDVRERRTMTGVFARDETLSLIARGPLLRAPRVPLEEATFVLGDQFAALKVVDLSKFEEDGRTLELQIRVIDQCIDLGVPGRHDRRGNEVVSFVPLAEKDDDLVAEITRDNDSTFIDIRKGSTFKPAPLMINACSSCSDSDIIIAPELTVDSHDIKEISSFLTGMSGNRPRLVVAGSGLSDVRSAESDLPYNEATILNANGATLWLHRKVSAYGMLPETAEGLSLQGTEGATQLMERIAWSDTVTIADIEGLGRCLVLICQDLMMASIPELLDVFRPDWVLVPILDSGTSLTRWPARRARELASAAEARFVIVSSLTMKAWCISDYPGEEIGVAIGPKHINRGNCEDDISARETQVTPETASRRFGTIQWRTKDGWSTYS